MTEPKFISKDLVIDTIKDYFREEINKLPYHFDSEIKEDVFEDIEQIDVLLKHSKNLTERIKMICER